MKKFFVATSLILFAGVVIVLSLRQVPTETHPAAETLPTPTEAAVVTQLPITVTPFVDGSQVTLIANYTEKKTGNDLMAENSCTYLVNGGFYTKEQTPVGYVKTTTGVLSKVKESLLFDGFLSINQMQTPRITRALPLDGIVSALQTGPILVENGAPTTLKIQNDKQARRMFALIDGNNKILFGMVTSSTLTDLPKIIFDWAKAQKITVADAINLDGGSASTYRGPNGIYPEISPIGSAFCIKD